MPHKRKQTYQQPLDLIILCYCCFFKFALLLFPDNNEQPSISVLFSITYKGNTCIIELVQSYAHTDLPNSYCKTARTTTNFFLCILQESPVWIFPLLCSCCLYLWHWHLGDFHLLSDLGWSTWRFSGTGTKAHFMHINRSDKKSSEVSSEAFPKIPIRLHPSSKHQISYCRSFLHYPFQKCKCRPPNAPSPKSWSQSISKREAFACPHSSATGKLEVQHTQRNSKNLSVTIPSWKNQNIWRIFKRS